MIRKCTHRSKCYGSSLATVIASDGGNEARRLITGCNRGAVVSLHEGTFNSRSPLIRVVRAKWMIASDIRFYQHLRPDEVILVDFAFTVSAPSRAV